MLSSIRNLSKSAVGKIIAVLFLLLIVASFAMADIQGVLSGGGFGGGANPTLAKAGSSTVTDRDVSLAMERRLSQVRQENPQAEYSTIAGDFDALLSALIDARVLQAFADRFGMVLSKRLIDAQIANIPGTRGLGGQFTEQSYANFLQQQRMSDEEVRTIVRSGLLQQLLIDPAAAVGRAPVGMATPYASMLLELREGEVALVPVAPFRAGLNPTPADLERYYAANRARYMVPEQRVLRIAKVGPEQVANVAASEQEIAAYYNENRAQYAPRENRVISQAVLPDQAAAQAIANRARGGQSFAAAAAPAGLSAADISVGPQTREQFTELAGDQVAAAAWGAEEGAVVGPIRSDLGWHVVKVDEVRREGGRPLEAVRGEIAAKLTADKRKEAIENLADQVQNAIDDGASFTEAATAARLAVVETPPITAAGTSRSDPDYRVPADLAPAVKTGFELAEGDDPVIEPLPNDAGYVLVAPARIIAAAPAPLASIREQVAQDWINAQASAKARQLAQAITAKAGGAPLEQAARGAPVNVPIRPVSARRIQLAQFQGQVPPALGVLFSLGEGKARLAADPEGEGFFVVKLNKITPGNALNQPALIAQTQQQMGDALSQEYGQQFLNAMRQTIGVERNERAIAAAKARITGGGS